ncbi:uncharacterized protein G2W53_016208 [Senna tora]|uniref:Uncharacterized protein n=1 Tax=Senna tora TaxID=362788 RepID=A0A834TVK5_9FABA|nr:uncharacterized protein G2W53_016208 [Senna tora]
MFRSDCGVPELDGAELCHELDGARASDLDCGVPELDGARASQILVLARSSMAALTLLMSQSTAWPGVGDEGGGEKNGMELGIILVGIVLGILDGNGGRLSCGILVGNVMLGRGGRVVVGFGKLEGRGRLLILG